MIVHYIKYTDDAIARFLSSFGCPKVYQIPTWKNEAKNAIKSDHYCQWGSS